MGRNQDAIRLIFEDVSLGAPENAVGFVMWRIVARYQRQVDRALLADNLTNLQFTTLSLVAWFGRDGLTVTQVQLARFAGIHPMQVSQTIKILETKRMVLRQVSDSDARAKRIEITKAGLRSLRAALPKVIAVQAAIFGDSGKPGGDLLHQLLLISSHLPGEDN
jgi:DNA-binding MarR family transcriptional regulator